MDGIRPIDIITFIVLFLLFAGGAFLASKIDNAKNDSETATSTSEWFEDEALVVSRAIVTSCADSGGVLAWTRIATTSRVILTCNGGVNDQN